MFGRSQTEKNRALETALDAEEGSIEEIRKALEKGAELTSVFGDYALTPLHLAARMNDAGTAEQAIALLLAQGADINVLDALGRTPLDCAVSKRYGDVSIVEKLLTSGADCTAGTYHSSALAGALANGSWEGAEYLLQRKPELSSLQKDGKTPLTVAIAKSVPVALLEKLIAAHADVNAGLNGDNTPLQTAVAVEKPEYVKFLLGCPGIDVNLSSPRSRPPLLAAAGRGNDDVFTMLLQAGADINKGNEKDGSPLIYALRNKKDDFALRLLEAGASAGFADADGKTALVLAAERDETALVEALLEARTKQAAAHKGKPEEETPARAPEATADTQEIAPWKNAKTVPISEDVLAALFVAVAKGLLGPAELLAQAGADLNGTDADGYTPLTRAARNGNVEMLTLLLKAGARLEETDLHGKTALEMASENRKEDAKKFLARYRRNLEKSAAAPPGPTAEDGRYRLLAPDMLEVNQGGLSTVFNFWTQQVIISRGPANAVPCVVQNFADLQRQEAIIEAYRILKKLGGDPPEPAEASLQKKSSGLRKG